MKTTTVAILCAVLGGAGAGDRDAIVSVPVTFVGAPPPTSITVVISERAGDSKAEARIESGRVPLRLSPAVTRIHFEARGFEPLDLTRPDLIFGATFFAHGRILFRLGPYAGGRPALEKFRVIAKVAGTSAVPRPLATGHGRDDSVSVELPPGEYDLLFDDSVSSPAIFRQISFQPGEERALPVPPTGSGSVDSFRVVDTDGRPVPGATATWRSRANVPEAELYGAWMESRRLSSDASGALTLDRIPALPYDLRIEARGFRPGTPASSTVAGRNDPPRRVVLRHLPALEIRLKPTPGDDAVTPARLTRMPDAPKAAADGKPFIPGQERVVWEGELRGSLPVRVGNLDGGRYRAIARAGNELAVADAECDVRESAPEIQPIIVSFEPRSIHGRVTRGQSPWNGVTVEAVPADAVVAPDSLKLATDVTTADGQFRMTLRYSGAVYLQPRRENGAAARGVIVDLRVEADVEKNLDYLGGELKLRVLDADTRQPVDGARVALQTPAQGLPGPRSTRTQATPADGVTVFDDIGAAPVDLTASAEGYATRTLHDLKVVEGENPPIELSLRKSVPLRLRVRDDTGRRIANAEIFRQQDPFVSMPRLAPLTSLGRTDSSGELVLRQLPGIGIPLYAIAAGYCLQLARLPAEPGDPDDPEANTLDLTLFPVRPGPVLRVIEFPGKARPDAVLHFSRDGIEISTTVLRRLAEANGMSPSSLMMADRSGDIHVQDYLAPGVYQVFALSPVDIRDPRTDLRDPLGNVRLPLDRDLQLQWLVHRPGFVSGGN